MKIAITGGIGSGKSYVCKLLQQRGISIYDCDSAAKRLMRTSVQLRQQLTELMGPDTYDSEGRLNKAAVADFMMQSPHNIQLVNGLVHPAVARDFLSSGMAWMECAILFENCQSAVGGDIIIRTFIRVSPLLVKEIIDVVGQQVVFINFV